MPAEPRDKVPTGPDWIHEVKHDGYRMVVQREGRRVRLFTRNGLTAQHLRELEAELDRQLQATEE